MVSPEFILTARICTVKPQWELFVASVNLAKNGEPQYHPIMNIFREGDLALLQIHPHITESPTGYRRIPLYDGSVGVRKLVTIAGWDNNGTESKLRETEIPIFSEKMCGNMLAKIGYTITKKNFCTFDEHRVKGCTHEDSGSALVAEGRLLGVLIFAGTDLPGPPLPDVFIRVNDQNEYYLWIKIIIGEKLYNANQFIQHPYYYPLLQYHPQIQTLHYSPGSDKLFVHPHPSHYSHAPRDPPHTVIHV
ncbi:uncharacterized protein LOC117178512 [Belonocnema kinseyi]|uniref:uncharacterized protein LOC117178512 n=1 Tax=Belonocnema kinseyi TaxID=2817044 RepID=UPI00143E0DF4|nr:uncharacterized protein LOC117178512 [Belonocnema kinseyi]